MIALDGLDAERFEAEAAARRAGRPVSGSRSPRPPTTSARSSACWRPADDTLRLLALYPEQMNIYADRGNILFLQRRCEWRGIGFEHATAGPGEGFDPAAHDLVYIGGGQDRDQRLVADDMLRTQARGARGGGRRRRRACSPSAAAISCLGHSYQLGDERIAGARRWSTSRRSATRARG